MRRSLAEHPGLPPQVSEVAARIVGSEVPHTEPLMQAGLDSLAAVDLRRELTAAFDLDSDALAPTLVFDYPSIEAIADHLLPLLPRPAAPPPPPPAAAVQAAMAAAGRQSQHAQMELRATVESVPRASKRSAPPINPNAPTLTGCALQHRT